MQRPRVPVIVEVEVDASSEETFLFFELLDAAPMSQRALGIFVRSATPEPTGTPVLLRVTSRAKRSSERRAEGERSTQQPPLLLEGRVMWVNHYRPGDVTSITPGMGIAIVAPDRAARQRLLRAVRKLAYLESTWPPMPAAPAVDVSSPTIN